jgi:hypothetical protein
MGKRQDQILDDGLLKKKQNIYDTIFMISKSEKMLKSTKEKKKEIEKQVPRYNVIIVESSAKHHKPTNPTAKRNMESWYLYRIKASYYYRMT